MGFPVPAHNSYQWHDLPADDTPLDAEHLMAAEDDLVGYVQQVAQLLGLGPTLVQSSAYSAQPGDFVPVDCSAASVAVTLPASPLDGSRVGVKAVRLTAPNTVTVNATGATFNTSSGSSSLTLSLLGHGVLLQYSQAQGVWFVTADDLPLSALDARYTQMGAGVASFNSRTGAVVPVSGDYAGVVASALSGATAATRFVGGTASGAPASGSFLKGDFVIDQTGLVWVCTTAGSPGSWTNAGASAGVSSFNSRVGAVSPASGDYTAAQVTNAADKSSGSAQTFTGNVSAPALVPSGLSGATAATRYVGGTASGAPASGTFLKGDFVIDQTGAIWVCTTAGSPGTWGAIGGNLGTVYGYLSNPVSTTSTSMASVAGLSFAIGASQVWKFEITGWLAVVGNVGAQVQLTGPSSPTLVEIETMIGGGGTTGNMTSFGSSSGELVGSNGWAFTAPLFVMGLVKTGLSAGTVQLQWATFSSGGTATLSAGTRIDARRIS